MSCNASRVYAHAHRHEDEDGYVNVDVNAHAHRHVDADMGVNQDKTTHGAAKGSGNGKGWNYLCGTRVRICEPTRSAENAWSCMAERARERSFVC